MPIIDAQYRTVSCDGCDKSITFDINDIKKIMEENSWLATLRIIQTAQGRNFCYHDDSCELKGVAAAHHNPEEKKRIEIPTNVSAINQAAASAKAAIEATKAIKAGGPVTLQGS